MSGFAVGQTSGFTYTEKGVSLVILRANNVVADKNWGAAAPTARMTPTPMLCSLWVDMK